MSIKIDPQGRRYTDHAPGADLDYSVDWTAWLAADETIADSEWTASAGITMSRDQLSADNKVASAFAAGGVAGQTYVLTNKITTSAGRIDSRTITLHCRTR